MEPLNRILRNKFPQQDQNRYRETIQQILADPDVKNFLNENREKLSADFVRRNASKLYEYADVKAKIARGEKTFMPGYYPVLHLNGNKLEVLYMPSRKLKQEKEAEDVQKRITTISLPKSMKKADLSNYEDTPGRDEALNAAVDFARAYLSDPKEFHKGLYLEGRFGVGKTYLLAGLANVLAKQGVECTLVHFPSFAVQMKNSIASNNSLDIIDKIKTAPILMLDDLGADQMSSWLRDDVLGVILQYRMQEELPTFFSSNFNEETLLRQYLTVNNRGESEPLKAQRIMERIKFLATEYHLDGNNRRNS